MNVLIKYLVLYNTFQLVFFRSITSLIIAFLVLKTKNISIWGNQKTLLIFRSLSGVISMVLFFWGIHYISLGSAVTLRYVAPIFTFLLTVIFLKEKIKSIQWIFIFMAFTGVLLIKGFDSSTSFLGLGLVLLAAFFSSIVFLLISKIGNGDHPLVIVHYFMFFATIVGAIGSICFWIQPNVVDFSLLLSLGIFGYFGQLYMTKAFQTHKAYMVAPFKYVEVLITLSFGCFFINEKYQVLHLIGVFLVILGLVLNTIYKFSKYNQSN